MVGITSIRVAKGENILEITTGTRAMITQVLKRHVIQKKKIKLVEIALTRINATQNKIKAELLLI